MNASIFDSHLMYFFISCESAVLSMVFLYMLKSMEYDLLRNARYYFFLFGSNKLPQTVRLIQNILFFYKQNAWSETLKKVIFENSGTQANYKKGALQRKVFSKKLPLHWKSFFLSNPLKWFKRSNDQETKHFETWCDLRIKSLLRKFSRVFFCTTTSTQ